MEEADAISTRGLQKIAKAWRRGDLHAQLWLMLYHAGRVAPSPIEARARMRTALTAWEGAGEDHFSRGWLKMKPLQHARITAHRYGGEWQDWIAIHDWIDRSKAIFPSMRRRMFIHSDFGEWLEVRIHGEKIGAEAGAVISTRNLFRDHQVEDPGRVVTLAEWLCEIDADYWMRRRKPPRQLEQVREEPAIGLAARWGCVPGDYPTLIDYELLGGAIDGERRLTTSAEPVIFKRQSHVIFRQRRSRRARGGHIFQFGQLDPPLERSGVREAVQQ
jgi:hypothetical protein